MTETVTRVGPLEFHPELSWALPAGLLLVASAILSYLALLVDSVVVDQMLCDLEPKLQLAFVLAFGVGAALLAIGVSRHVWLRLIASLLAFCICAWVAFMGVRGIYASHCAHPRVAATESSLDAHAPLAAARAQKA
jgi:hypothetical protein